MPSFEKLQQPRYRWIGFAFISISLLATSINNMVLNVAMPVIARELNASTSDLQWIQDAYILVFAALLLAMGALSDRYGRKRFLLVGVSSFALFAILAALARTTTLVIFARALQGIGAAIIMPSTLSLISALFPEPRERAKAIAIWSAMFGAGVSIGPILGGLLLEMPGFMWNGIFLVNVPFALIAFVGVYIYVPESYGGSRGKLDIPGVVLSTAGLFALVYAIIKGGELGWSSPDFLLGMAVALLLISGFIWWERHSPEAMLPLHFFKNPSFSVASITMMFALFGLFGFSFFLPLFFQGIQNYSALETGLLMFPQAVLSVTVSWNSHHIINWIGVKKTTSWGMVLVAVGAIMLASILRTDTSYWIILASLIITFIGIDIALPAATVSIMGSVPDSKAGIGSGMNEMTGNTGGALGIAILGAILNRVYLKKILPLESLVPQGMLEDINSSIFSAHKAIESLGGDTVSELLQVVDNAFVSGLRIVMLVCFMLFTLLALFTARFLPSEIIKLSDKDQ
jgi:EmrB/QacA subfamily drug resistance transporter